MKNLKPVILIIDDQLDTLQWLSGFLSSNGYKVLLSNDAAMALESDAVKEAHLILLDIMMPSMNGFEACRRLKADPVTKDKPVIFFSSLDDMEEKTKGFEAGAVDFIQKPFSDREILLRVKTHLDIVFRQQELEQAVEARTNELRREITVRAAIEDELRNLLDEKKVLMRELQHRVKNHLLMVESVLKMTARTATNEREINILQVAQARVRALENVYALLYKSETLTEINAAVYIKELIASWKEIVAQENTAIELLSEVDSFSLPVEIVVPVGLIINELLTNSIKYAFQPGEPGQIRLVIKSAGDKVRFSVQDNGCGMTEKASKGLGLSLVEGLTTQLSGTLTMQKESGTKTEIVFPLNV